MIFPASTIRRGTARSSPLGAGSPDGAAKSSAYRSRDLVGQTQRPPQT